MSKWKKFPSEIPELKNTVSYDEDGNVTTWNESDKVLVFSLDVLQIDPYSKGYAIGQYVNVNPPCWWVETMNEEFEVNSIEAWMPLDGAMPIIHRDETDVYYDILLPSFPISEIASFDGAESDRIIIGWHENGKIEWGIGILQAWQEIATTGETFNRFSFNLNGRATDCVCAWRYIPEYKEEY